MRVNKSQLAESLLKDNINFKIPVTGDSMSPVLRTGDVIYIEPVKAEGLDMGDILIFKTEGNMTAHRLVRILRSNGRSMFLTKGDTFSSVDMPLKEEDIIGRAYAVEKFGLALNFKKGIFSIFNRLSYALSPVSSFLYNIRRQHKGFDAAYDTGLKSNEEMFITVLLRMDFSDEKPSSDMAVILKDSVDLASVLAVARNNGISQKLYTILKKLQDNKILKFKTKSESDFLNALRNDYLHTAAKNTLLYAEFKKAINAFRDKKIEVLAMKGVALAELIYKDIGVRAMSDIDLLIKKQDIEKADNALKKIGYTAVDQSPFDGMESPDNYLTTRDYRSENPMHPSFHIHWHMVNSSIPAPYSSRIDMDGIWEEAVPVEIADVPALAMAPHHFLMHLAEHAMRATHSASKLIYLVDIASLISNPPLPPFTKGGVGGITSGGEGEYELDWHKVVKASKDYGLDIFVYNILNLVRLNTGIDVPERVLSMLKHGKRTIGERLFFNITARGYGISGLSYLVHMGMNRGISRKLLFILRTLFPPAWVLAKRHPYSCGKTYTRFYLYRFKDILSGIFSLLIGRLRKICLAFIICLPIFSISSVYADENNPPAPPFTKGGQVEITEGIREFSNEKSAAYIMESGVPEYLVASGDVLNIKIWQGFEEKKFEVTVKPTGFITVAFVEAKVSDMTISQIEAKLKKALSDYIKEPRVEVSVKEYKGRTVTVFGAIQSQSLLYALKGKTMLSKLVVLAGGFTKEADLENIQIKTAEGKVQRINLFQIMLGNEIIKDVVVDSGDTVYIPYKSEVEEKKVFLFGEIQNPGAYRLKPGLTLLQAIGGAKGYKEEALIDEIKIIRGGLDSPQIISADLKKLFEEGDLSKDVFLQTNDIVYIPRSRIGNWNAFLAKMRPTLEFLILPFAGTRVIEDVLKGK